MAYNMLRLACLSLVIRLVVGEAEGSFTNDFTQTPVLLQSNELGITWSWNTPYTLTNLWYIWDGDMSIDFVQRQCPIKIGVEGSSYDWKVNCVYPPNCESNVCNSTSQMGPFKLRAVPGDKSGNALTGGFLSDSFYVDPIASSSTTSSSILASSSTRSSRSSSEENSSTTSSPSPSTYSSTEPFITFTNVATSATAETVAPQESNSTLGIGVGVGVGVGATLLLCGGAFFLWRRHHGNTEQRKAQELPSYPESNAGWHQEPKNDQKPPTPTVEAPGRDPQELPGHEWR